MHIATYGSLTIPEVMRALLDKDFVSEPIVIDGYERFTLVGKRYPGLIESVGKKVDGRIYFDLDPVSVQLLDRFEDEIYDREIIAVETTSKGVVQARVYVVPVSSRNLLSDSPWIAEDFVRVHLSDYVEMCKRFRAEVLSACKQQVKQVIALASYLLLCTTVVWADGANAAALPS